MKRSYIIFERRNNGVWTQYCLGVFATIEAAKVYVDQWQRMHREPSVHWSGLLGETSRAVYLLRTIWAPTD